MAVGVHATVRGDKVLDLDRALVRGQEAGEDMRHPRARVHVRGAVLERAVRAPREDGGAHVPEGGGVRGHVVCDLEVGQDLLLAGLHPGPGGHRLPDVALWPVRVDAYGGPVVPGRAAVAVDVDEGVVEAMRERDGGNIERVGLQRDWKAFCCGHPGSLHLPR